MTDSDKPNKMDDALGALSALHDGEAGEAELNRACLHWRSDACARQRWHAWALVGDVLRSEDLAQSATHDEAFLNRLRQRMRDEPVVLAPSPLDRQIADDTAAEMTRFEQLKSLAMGRLAPVRRRWVGPTAVAAGFVAVAGALVMLRTGSGGGEAERLAAGSTASPEFVGASASSAVADDVVLVRNADLDRYLAAHREFAQGPAFAAPGGMRQVVATPSGK